MPDLMSLSEWLQITAEFRALWERCDRLTVAEQARLAALFDLLQQARSYQETAAEHRRRLADLWAQRADLSVREAGLLEQRLGLLLQDIELQELWSRRDELSNAAWTRLCRLIHQVLSANLKKLSDLLKILPEPPSSYLWDFISRKVFEPCKAPDATVDTRFHTGTLGFYFRNFLLDRLDERQRRSLPPPEPPADQEPAAFDLFERIGPADLHPQWGDARHPAPDVDQVLREAGLSWERVGQAANALIGSLEAPDRILLKCSHCADREGQIPVDRFKALLSSPAYRTTKLRNRLQRWCEQTLGIDPDPEHEPVRLAALQILCWRALLEIETDCAALAAQLNPAAPDGDPAPSA